MQILLVHGLGRTPLSLFGLASELRRNGHRTQFFCYSPTFEKFTGIIQRLVRRLRKLAVHNRPVGLIAHSLGGILLRLALQEIPDLHVHHFIMLGTPNKPPRMARLAWRWRPFRLFTGGCGRFLATASEFSRLAGLTVPHTVLAGTAGPRSRFTPFGFEPNDCVVAVSETIIDTGREVVQLPVWHTTIMDALTVRKQIVAIMNRVVDPIIHSPFVVDTNANSEKRTRRTT